GPDILPERRRVDLPELNGGEIPDDVYVQVAEWTLLGADSGADEGVIADGVPVSRTFIFRDGGAYMDALVGSNNRFARSIQKVEIDAGGTWTAEQICPAAPANDSFRYVMIGDTHWLCQPNAPGSNIQGECFIFVRQGR